MAEITVEWIADIVAKRKGTKVSHATIKRDLNALSSVLNFAAGNRWRKDNPVLAFLTENKRTKQIRERRAPMASRANKTLHGQGALGGDLCCAN
jgi:integrase/recombinase XerD